MKWIVGIDGGGTKTTACAGDSNGNLLGRLEKGPANYQVTGIAAFQNLVSDLVDEFCLNCGLNRTELQLVSMGLAGVDRVHDREIILAALSERRLGCHYIVNNDATIALTAGLGETRGIVLIAGTGSIAYGINPEGRVTRAGGWGHIISDEGSGYAIGRQALCRAVKSGENRDKETILSAKIIEHLGVADQDGVIGFIYHPSTGKAAIAALAEVVAAAADNGDIVATEILAEAADSLAALVESVITRGFASGQEVRVCTYGGVINNLPLIRQRIAERLAGKALLVMSDQEPVMGALQIGYNYLHTLK
jgi:N-acetylglucosamine kinase-like BadF-type ATPase